MNGRARIDETARAVLGQQQRAIKIDETRLTGQQEGWRHRQRAGDHATDHEFEAKFFGKLHQGQCLGQPPRFVEFDVDCIVALAQGLETSPVMDAFIGADWHDMLDFGEWRVFARGQRLFDKTDARLGAGFKVALEIRRRPRLIGVHDKRRVWGGVAHSGESC